MENFYNIQQKQNEKFYQENAFDLYNNFLTFENCRKIAQANARNLVQSLPSNKTDVHIIEIGVGNGKYSLNFINELKKHNLSIKYTLVDFSKPMLDFAKSTLKQVKDVEFNFIQKRAQDLSYLDLKYSKIDLLILNELVDDIGSRIFVKQKNSIKEVLFELKGNKLVHSFVNANLEPERLDILNMFFNKLPSGFWIPLNTGFSSMLNNLIIKADRIFISDYGFYNASDFEDFSAQEWNQSIIRRFSNQITVDVNFLYLSALLRSKGFSVFVKKQKQFVENLLNEKLFLIEGDDLCYYTLDELKNNKQRFEELGYDIDSMEEIEEDDGYYVLFAEK